MALKDWTKKKGDWLPYYVGKNGWIIETTQRQDRDGKNAFLYGATIYNHLSLGTGRNKKILFKEVRDDKLLKKKIEDYMRSH
jgi:hypothetical protein